VAGGRRPLLNRPAAEPAHDLAAPATGPPQGEVGRVAAVQRQVRPTLILAAGFAFAAPVAAAVPHRTGQWLPLHLFLVGGMLLAISGATQLFAVTWAAGPPAPDRLVAAQRLLLAAGAGGLAAGREAGGPPVLLAAAGSAVAAALALLAVALQGIVRRAVQRRFDVTWRWYRTALAAGGAGVMLGVALATGTLPTGSTGPVRDAHIVLNVLGLVGLVVAGTLPFFVATQARMQMSRWARTGFQDGVRRVLVAGLTLAVAGRLADRAVVAGAGLLIYAAGLAGLVCLVPRPGRRQLRWAGPRLVQLGCGLVWWFGTVLVMAVSLLRDGTAPPPAALVTLVVGGYAQILVASLAYLGPVLRGGGYRHLSAGFTTTASWWGLVLGNGAAVALATGHRGPGGGLLGLWLLDTAWRAWTLFIGRSHAPQDQEAGQVLAGVVRRADRRLPRRESSALGMAKRRERR
jgi:hypothetical protein